jgi:DNA primase
LRAEFLGAIEQLEKQVLQQRIDELQQRLSQLDEAEKYELRALLQARLRP